MPLQAQQIVTLACQIAKCPGFTSQGGQFLNATLQDLCQGYDLDAALGTNAFSFNSAAGQGSGPYTLPADYLRTQVKDGKDEFFYTINGVPYPLIQCTKAEYDWMVQTPGFQNFPYYYATDLSVSPPQLFVWPPASGAYPCIMRYYRLMPDIATPESSATVPWFLNTEILITSTAGRLMGITGDSRYEAYMSEDVEKHPTSWKAKLSTYLKNVEDREGAVHTVGRDRRRWGRSFDLLKKYQNDWLATAVPRAGARLVRGANACARELHDALHQSADRDRHRDELAGQHSRRDHACAAAIDCARPCELIHRHQRCEFVHLFDPPVPRVDRDAQLLLLRATRDC